MQTASTWPTALALGLASVDDNKFRVIKNPETPSYDDLWVIVLVHTHNSPKLLIYITNGDKILLMNLGNIRWNSRNKYTRVPVPKPSDEASRTPQEPLTIIKTDPKPADQEPEKISACRSDLINQAASKYLKDIGK